MIFGIAARTRGEPERRPRGTLSVAACRGEPAGCVSIASLRASCNLHDFRRLSVDLGTIAASSRHGEAPQLFYFSKGGGV